jgi:hypothetical protein
MEREQNAPVLLLARFGRGWVRSLRGGEIINYVAQCLKKMLKVTSWVMLK